MNIDEARAVISAAGQPYEIGTVECIRGSVPGFVNGPQTLRDLYEQNLSDDTFLVYEEERLSFTEAYAKASRIAHVLHHRFDIQKGDRVAISMRNYPEWILAFKAITAIGAIAVGMNSLWLPDEMEYGLTDSGAKLIFADEERLERLSQLSGNLALHVISVRTTRQINRPVFQLETLLQDVPTASMPDVEIVANDPALILYTSGSTGRPKGVLSSQRNILTAIISWEFAAVAQAMTIQSQKDSPHSDAPYPAAALLGVPLFHVLGMHVVFLSSYRSKRKLVSMYKWDPAHAAELIESERITTFSGPPAMTGDLAREALRTNSDLSSLLAVGGGGASRAPEQVKQIDDSFSKAAPNTGWGMTETNAIGTSINGHEYLEHAMSAGRALPCIQLRVVNDSGAPVPAGERGELQIRGPQMFIGYWNRPEVDAEVFDGDWFRTGDVSYIDKDGFMYIVDRIKDLIIRGGENIGCGTVEAALMSHPLIIEAIAYAVPDDRLGEEVAATIYIESPIEEEDLRTYLSGHLSRFEIPRYIRMSPVPLPRTDSGKIFRRQIRDTAVSELQL